MCVYLLHQCRDLLCGILLSHALPNLFDLVLIVSVVGIMEGKEVELWVPGLIETNTIFKLGTW